MGGKVTVATVEGCINRFVQLVDLFPAGNHATYAGPSELAAKT
jgi:hypothetical protein